MIRKFVFVLMCLSAVTFILSETAQANLTVKGTITYEIDGSPVEGARIRAWDSDIGSDEFMGEAFTNANGYYEIHYEGGHWDLYPHRITKWRPDIYIRVGILSNGQWIRVWVSETYDDHPHRNDLIINASIKGGAIVFGTITEESDGRPLSNLRVTAYDWDPTSGNDFMGSADTDSEGGYRIEYARKHWDTAPHASGLWRPDIFIKVSKNGVGGFTIENTESSIHHDQRLSEDLRIDHKVKIIPMDSPSEKPYCYNFISVHDSCKVFVEKHYGCQDNHEYSWTDGCFGWFDNWRSNVRKCFDKPLKDLGPCREGYSVPTTGHIFPGPPPPDEDDNR